MRGSGPIGPWISHISVACTRPSARLTRPSQIWPPQRACAITGCSSNQLHHRRNLSNQKLKKEKEKIIYFVVKHLGWVDVVLNIDDNNDRCCTEALLFCCAGFCHFTSSMSNGPLPITLPAPPYLTQLFPSLLRCSLPSHHDPLHTYNH